MHLELMQRRGEFEKLNLEAIFDKIWEEPYGYDLLDYNDCQLPYDDVRTAHFVIQYPSL